MVRTEGIIIGWCAAGRVFERTGFFFLSTDVESKGGGFFRDPDIIGGGSPPPPSGQQKPAPWKGGHLTTETPFLNDVCGDKICDLR